MAWGAVAWAKPQPPEGKPMRLGRDWGPGVDARTTPWLSCLDAGRRGQGAPPLALGLWGDCGRGRCGVGSFILSCLRGQAGEAKARPCRPRDVG